MKRKEMCDTFTCEVCKGTFHRGTSTDHRAEFGDPDADGVSVCDDCYEMLMMRVNIHTGPHLELVAHVRISPDVPITFGGIDGVVPGTPHVMWIDAIVTDYDSGEELFRTKLFDGFTYRIEDAA